MSGSAKTPIRYLPRGASVPDFEKGKVADHFPETQKNYLQARSCYSLPHANRTTRPGEGLFPTTSNGACEEGRNKAEGSYSCFCWFLVSCWRKLKSRKIPEPCVQPTVNNFYLHRRHTTKSLTGRHKVEIDSVNTHPVTSLPQETKRDWGEERVDDVIYSIKLKRVNRVLFPERGSDGLQWETQKVRNIKGATLPYLVKYICRTYIEEQGQRHFLTVFLATYRSFASPDVVLDLIKEGFESLADEANVSRNQVLSSTLRVLQTWMDRYFDEDFYDPPNSPLVKKLRSIAEQWKKKEKMNVDGFLSFIETKMNFAKSNRKSKANLWKGATLKPPCFNENNLNLDSVKTFLNDLQPHKVAQQLTLIDAKLFLNVIPHHCLYAVRSSKGKPATVKATIDQFNRVVYSVLGTCLHPDIKPSQRVKIICKWIEVAQACRELKNFSSLRAVVSGLQTHPIHRLRRTWQQIPQDKSDLMKELEQINTKASIQKVGTAKFNFERSAINKVRRDASMRRQRDLHSGITYGTVPYLGSFLTDLNFLHTANSDYLEDNLINFDKGKKEFELLAQLQLWQVSCRSYHHWTADVRFFDWFSSVTLPSDDQAYKLSEEVEATVFSPTTPSKRSLADVFFTHHQQEKDVNESSSLKQETSPKINGHADSTSPSSEDERTVNVQIIKRNSREDIVDRRKEIKLGANDRSPAFVRKAFNLFELESENPNKFKVLQLLPGDKELTIPDNGNVYYAMNTSADEYNFVLVEEGAEVHRERNENSSNAVSTFPKMKKSSQKIVHPSLATSGASPMKAIYRHLGISGFSWASSTGNYSFAKASQHDCVHENRRKCSSLKRNGKLSADTSSSGPEMTSPWRRLTGSRKEKERNVQYEVNAEAYKPLTDWTSLPPSSDDQRTSSTWPRNQTFTVADSGRSKLHRRAAVRKHHSHPRQPMSLSLKVQSNRYLSTDSLSTDFSSDVSRSQSSSVTSSPSIIRKRDEFMVTYEEHLKLQRHISMSAEMLQSGYDDVGADVTRLRRSASDPGIIDTVEEETEVFKDANHNPSIKKRYLIVEGTKTRRSSETHTTYL